MKCSDINIRDPFVLVHDGTYYLYGTRGATCWGPATGFDVYVSQDMENWTGPHVCFENDGTFWADRNYWAPEVHAWQGKFYMFASFKSENECRGTQILVSDTPDGTFVPLTPRPVTPRDWECLDGTLYVSPEGKPWIVFCHEWVQVKDGEICAMPLTEDLSAPAGEPVLLFKASAAPWVRPVNREGGLVTDGPFMHRCHNGTLLLIWSSFGAQGYTQAVARSESGDITGPWVQEETLLMEKDGGHGMLFRDFSGQLRLVLHSPNKTPLERPKFFPVEETGGALRRLD